MDVLEDKGALRPRPARWRIPVLLRDFPFRDRVHSRARQPARRFRPDDRLAHGSMAVAADDPGWPLPDADGEQAPRSGGADRGRGERRLTPLERALRERIRAEGPITVEAYMEACNANYYSTRDPFGARGDFITAPEISQMFGELIGGTLADCWARAGSPADAIYAELGPGRGTLASD